MTTLIPYAVLQERDGKRGMLDALLHAVRAAESGEFIWKHISPLTTALLAEANGRAIVLVSPHMPWDEVTDEKNLVKRWATAVWPIQGADEVGRFVVDALLQLASNSKLREHIPSEVWRWLNELPSLSPVCRGRLWGSHLGVVRAVRKLEDVNILKSYFLIIWSELDCLDPAGFPEMCAIIQQNFVGIRDLEHRTVLINRLDDVLEKVDQGLQTLNPYLRERDVRLMKEQYRRLKEVLQEEDQEQ
jgi:hypothetical protein